MLQLHLLQRIEAALNALTKANPLMEIITALASANHVIEVRLLTIAEGASGNQLNESASAIHSHLAAISNITRGHSPRILFREVEALQKRLEISLVEGVSDPKEIILLLSELDDFAESYNTYVTHQTGVNALPLLLISRQVKRSLKSLNGYLEYIRNNIIDAQLPSSNESEFSLVLYQVIDLKNITQKLDSLGELYSELCYVLEISEADYPLRIAKIESGSLLTRLLGDTRAVALMLSLIEDSVKYFHRNYTVEGKIAAIPKKIESLNEILNFSNRLKDSGVDVSELNEKLVKSAASITNSLNTLVSDQSKVEINGQVHSISKELQAGLLEHSSKPKLEYKPSESPALPLNPPNDPINED
jgi:hypothetical protein